jgi:histidine triad (HIT) family protein
MADKCVFCRIVAGEIKEEYLYEDEHVIVHKDIHPRADIHYLITSKKHFDDFSQMMEEEPELLTHIGKVVEIVVEKLGMKGGNYTWGFHSGAKQSVQHLHAQLLSVKGDELVL